MGGDPQRGHVAIVVEQQGSRVVVALPMVGFPEGFELAPGARVLLEPTPTGVVVRPLTRFVRASVPADVVETRGSFVAEGREKVLQDATVIGEQPREGDPERSREDVMWVVESSDPDVPEQVIAVRRANPTKS